MNAVPCDDAAASEIVGAIVLITIFVAAAAIVMTLTISQPNSQKLPAFNAIITNESKIIRLYHAGGDPVPYGELSLTVDGIDVPFTGEGTDQIWSIGETLTASPAWMPNNVQLILTPGTGQFLLASEFLGEPQSVAVPTVTTTATPTPTVPPVADFTGTPTSGASPLMVTFTDTSTGSPTSWAWDVDNDGSTDYTIQNPVHTYASVGIYSVKLTVTNAAGSNFIVKTGYITVNPPAPTANFTGTPLAGVPPLTVTFTDTSTGSPISWAWDFGDIGAGNTSTLQNPVHVYAGVGTYSVALNASNAAGSNILVKPNYITVSNPAPTVSSITPNSGFNDTSLSIINLAGTGFLTGATVKLNATARPDIPGTVVVVVSPTWITCVFDLTNVPAGSRNVVVTNPDGLSGMLVNGFTVNQVVPAPTVISMTNTTGNRGWPVVESITGTGFVAGSVPKLNRTGSPDIVATNIVVVSSTQITCTFDLLGKDAGIYNLVVTNPDGKNGMRVSYFTLNSPAPTLTSRSPTSANRGWPINVNLGGTGFQPGVAVRLTRIGYTDIPASAVTVSSPTTITCTFDLLGVTAGTWNILVTNTDGQSSGTLSFTVNSPAPSVPNSPAFSPNTGARGTTVTVTAPGSNLQPGMAVVLTNSPTTITAYNVNVISPTQVVFTIDIPAGATTGAYRATYTNTDGGSGGRNNRFTVT